MSLLLAALATGIAGIGRSLWLDEAWVANSIHAPSLAEMFYYPHWLQTSPPLYLLASRAAVGAFGFSNVSLRIAPLSFGLAAVVLMFSCARRVVAMPWAALAGALLAFSPAAVEYSHTCKQYSAGLAATTLVLLAAVRYLQSPSRAAYYWLVAAAAVALPLAYSTAFLIPGLLIAAASRGRKPVLLAAVCGAILLALYFALIRPNFSPSLRRFWAADADTGLSLGLLAALLFAVAAGARAARAALKRKAGTGEWLQIFCACPCVLLAAAAALDWYPLTYRTRLFALPCFLLLLAINADDLSRWLAGAYRRGQIAANAAVVCLLLATVLSGIRAQVHARPGVPKEDAAGAVRYLEASVTSGDLLLVHPSAEESFRLYAAMDRWNKPPVIFGRTGLPCCPRGEDWRLRASTEQSVNRDIDRMVPSGFTGRVWMLYTIRPTHWDYVGLDESKIWRHHLADRGCYIWPPNRQFENMAITLAECPKTL
ncbi:MAG TPA: glycosyltransferase family 39 protein [Bryobacteraceae bacterium]|nr:glycosyltransferase family 39 protein [Bryobacteraceae bacterium]